MPGQAPQVGLAQPLRDQHLGERAAEHLLAGVAEGALRGGVEAGDAALGVHRDEAVERRLEQRLADPPALLERRPGADVLAHVGGQDDPPAVRHPALAHPDPAPVGEAVLPVEQRLLALGQPPLEVVLAHLGVEDRAERRGLAPPVGPALAGRHGGPQALGQVLRVAGVVVDEPVLGVEDREPVAQALGRGPEAGLALGEPRLVGPAPGETVPRRPEPASQGRGRARDRDGGVALGPDPAQERQRRPREAASERGEREGVAPPGRAGGASRPLPVRGSGHLGRAVERARQARAGSGRGTSRGGSVVADMGWPPSSRARGRDGSRRR